MNYAAHLKNVQVFTSDSLFARTKTLAIDQLSIPFNSVIALIGPNGAGKSTLLKLLAGLIPIQTGSLKMNVKKVIYVPHECTIPLYLTVAQALWFVAHWRAIEKKSAHAAISFWLEEFGLTEYEGSTLATLSYGMRQRVMIAQALVQEPDLLLLDEPFSGIDQHFYQLIQKHCLVPKPSSTVIYVSHHQLATSTDSVMLMQHGNIIAQHHFIANKELHDYFRT